MLRLTLGLSAHGPPGTATRSKAARFSGVAGGAWWLAMAFAAALLRLRRWLQASHEIAPDLAGSLPPRHVSRRPSALPSAFHLGESGAEVMGR